MENFGWDWLDFIEILADSLDRPFVLKWPFDGLRAN